MSPVFLYPLPTTPISNLNLLWGIGTMNKLKRLLKRTFFFFCYAAVRREDEKTIWKYNIKIHKIIERLGTVVGKLFCLVSTILDEK